MKPNTITFIVAVRNGYATLNRCLESVVNQSLPNWELIVMDGGSTDGTPEIIHAYSDKIAYWESKPDHGIYHAWNKALQHAGGEWICFLGADDWLWDRDVVGRMIPYLEAAAADGCPIVYGRVRKLNASGRVVKKSGKPWRRLRWQLVHGMPLIHAGIFHHRRIFDEHGGFDETFRIAGDYEMMLRVLRAEDARFAEPVMIVGHAGGGVSDTRKIHTLKEIQRARQMHGLPRFSWVWTAVYLRELLKERLFPPRTPA